MMFRSRCVSLLLASACLLATAGCATLESIPGLGPATPAEHDKPISDSENRVRETAAPIGEMMLGGALDSLFRTSMAPLLQCYVRYGTISGKSRGADTARRRQLDVCIAATVTVGAKGAGQGYAKALEVQASEKRVRQAELAVEDLKADNERSRAYIDDASRVVRERAVEINRMRGELQKGALSDAEAERALERDKATLKKMEETLLNLEKSEAAYAEAARQVGGTQNERKQLQAGIAERRKQIASLKAAIDEYVKAQASISRS